MKKKKILNLIFAILTVCLWAYLFGVISFNSFSSHAQGISTDYKETLFNQDNGLGNSEVNCIYQTKSGYIWIGTDGGLYRYNGSEFRLFNLWNTDKSDVYYINDLFQDSNGSLWVSTNNYGLFRISGSDIYHFSDAYYSGVKCVNGVCQSADGVIYVATAYGVYTVDETGEKLIRNETLQKHNIRALTSTETEIWGIYGGNTIFCINQDGSIVEKDSVEYTTEEISTIASDPNGNIYIGTVGNDVLSFNSLDDVEILSASCDGINTIYCKNSRVYICADNGVGYFSPNGHFSEITNISTDTYISDMVIDYEGNFWFASNKSGIVYLSKSKFANLNRKYNVASNVTNCVKVIDGITYIGTDEGLYILDSSHESVFNELTEYLSGVSIRDIIQDQYGNIWFGTYRRYGVVKYSVNGGIDSYNKATGLLSNLINSLYELNDGSIAVGTEDGISIIGRTGKITKNYNYDNGLEYSNIISLYQNEDGDIYAGSDGGGLYIISGDEIKNFTDEDGLTSNVVSCVTKGENGIWIGTNNGLSYYDGTFRAISNIDFSNNIYSVIVADGNTYVIGSKGLIIATEDELLSTVPLTERYYSSGDGLENSISSNSQNTMNNGIIYVCTVNGVETFNTYNIVMNDVPPKLTVSEVDVDGTKYYYDQMGGELVIPSDTQRIEISFAVLSYSNRDNIQVQYQLVGFDNEPDILTTEDIFQAVYTNLDGGEYTFEASAVNSDGVYSDEEIMFKIIKEEGFLEKKSVRISILALVLLNILLILFITFRLWKKFTGKSDELKELAKKHEDVIKDNTAKTDYLANMSNEIKLPINAMISSASNMLKDGTVDEQSQNQLFEIISKGNDVIDIVDETILLARIESGAEEVVNEPYSVTTLICDISDGMLNKLTGTPIKFLVDLGDNIPDILVGDFDKVKKVLEILLDNSIKYTKEGSITLSVDYYDFGKQHDDDEKSRIVFSVSDTGIGISDERLEHLFEIYYVDEAKKTSSTNGKGVSLSIAKGFVDILGGELEVESTYGAGATFTFSLDQSRPSVSGNLLPMNDNIVDRVSREEAEKMWAPDLQILLVDDDELSRNVSLDVINEMEIKCDTATSGLSAIDMVMSNNYDMVFMDIAMPVMNGIDALNEIRDLSDESYQTLPIIAMTEDVIGKNRQEIIDEGFSDVILKPFDITILASLVNRFADKEKIKHRTSDVTQYISESRYSEGLSKLEEYLDVAGVIGRIGGNVEVYNKILFTFYNQNRDSIEELSSKLDSDYRGVRNKVHNIRTGFQNIGATEGAEIAIKIENAFNLGNRHYVEDNIPLIYDCIAVVNELIEEYMVFVDDQKGLTDSEYSEKHGKKSKTDEEESGPKTINIDKLKAMRNATYDEDAESIKTIFEEIRNFEYVNEDKEFIAALADTIENGDMVQINDLLNTYIDLKSEL